MMNTIKNHLPYAIRHKLNQRGFSPILIIGLLAAGIIGGTILVQNGVSFIPKAAEQEDLNPSAGKTQDCSKITEAAAKVDCQKTNDEICAKDTVTYCDNRNGNKAIRKSGGYYDPSNANTDPLSGCVFDYREVPGKDSECTKTESRSGDVVYTTKEEAKTLDSDRAKQASQAPGAPGTAAPAGSTAVCKDTNTEKTFKDEKVSGNLVRFYAILAGMPEYCVPVDLGVEPKQTAKSVDGQEGRLMLCSDKEGDLSWRVIVGDKLVKANKEPAPQKETLESGFKTNIENAKKAAGITSSGSSCPGGVCP